MKIRNGFVSNSSSSSFIIALPKSYTLSEEELSTIREEMEDYDCYFTYYEELAEEAGETELVDERERIQKMIETGKIEEEITEPVTDKIKNTDIQKGFDYLTTNGYLWTESYNWSGYEIPIFTAAVCIIEVLELKIKIASLTTCSENGQILNILADDYINSKGMGYIKEHFNNEN